MIIKVTIKSPTYRSILSIPFRCYSDIPKVPLSNATKSVNTSSNKSNHKDDPSSDSPKEPDADEINSAIVERMKQILEEKISTNASNMNTLRQVDSSINSIFQKYAPPGTDIKQANSYIKSEPLLKANKHARDIYNTQPWQGEETNIDANLRMILDSKPPPMKLSRKAAASTTKEKLAQARDLTLDYKLNPKSSGSTPKDDNFRELYKERLLGPDQFIPLSSSATDYVGSIASNRINSSINLKTGQFETPDMAKVRGKPLNREHLANCTDSNYFMNQILNKQSVLPPWIESQRGLNSEIDRLRSKIDQMWFTWIIHHSSIAPIVKVSSNLEVIEDSFEKNLSNFTFNINGYKVLPKSELEYIEAKIESINKQIRDYNLQCPSSSGHKFKLSIDKELKDSYFRTLENFSKNLEIWFDKHKRKSPTIQINRESMSPGLLSIWGDDNEPHLKATGSIEPNPNQDTSLHFWEAIKDIFKKK
ncbi:uncharacterized protein J8A68_003476 [[Candida] subhashii]|uniref:DnaJ homologue subfamily C member 28 conserved domain-containing protein n=1 Tax=[Candida] subhashii TaxID=561895 RepID=A0A8J5QMH6_9ASCO|nr:uncharacterized protein J8A68_003476 [[Candida] subhashii]KAG7663007.1 hypothetical protein J8A68_003476 [[Candida] subhashii]